MAGACKPPFSEAGLVSTKGNRRSHPVKLYVPSYDVYQPIECGWGVCNFAGGERVNVTAADLCISVGMRIWENRTADMSPACAILAEDDYT